MSGVKRSMSQTFIADVAIGTGKKPADIPEVFQLLSTIELPNDDVPGKEQEDL